jgi:hypothetical protein
MRTTRISGAAQAFTVVRTQRARRHVTAVLVAGLAASAVAVVTACGGHEGKPARFSSTSAACAAIVEWRGTTYYGTHPRQPLTLGAVLDGGTVPPCNDTVGTGVEPETESKPTALARVVGLPPEQAIATAVDMLYVAPGYFPQFPGTPLHDAIYGSESDVPDERGNVCRDAQTKELKGKVRSAVFGFLWVDRDHAGEQPPEEPIFVEARTVFDGGGEPPQVTAGATVSAQVLVCRKRDDPHFLKLVATRLTIGG